MADVVPRQRYAGETRPVEIKQNAQKGSAAHPGCDEAKNETRGATVTRVDGDRAHGGEDFVDDVVPTTAVGKMTKQERNKDHSIKTKL